MRLAPRAFAATLVLAVACGREEPVPASATFDAERRDGAGVEIVESPVDSGESDEPTPAATPVAATVRDSAGIEIVTEPLDPEMRIEMTEELRIGSVSGSEHERFSSAGDIGFTDSGALVVADPQGSVVRVFAPDGTFIRQWGSEGEGPGEFDGFGLQMAVSRDTVVLMDRDRLHTFLASGEFVGTVRGPRKPGVLPFSLAGTASGWRLQFASANRRPDTTSLIFAEIDPRTAEIGRELHALHVPRSEPVSGTNLHARPPFEPGTLAAFDPIGRLYLTRAARYEIEVRSADGELERIIRPEWERRPITDEVMEGWVAYRRDAMCSSEESIPDLCQDYVNEVLPAELALRRPEFIPPVSSLYPGDVASGGVIVSRRDTDPNLFDEGDPHDFDVFDGAGRFRGRLTTDETFWPVILSGAELIGWIRDELDVPYIVRYRLVFR